MVIIHSNKHYYLLKLIIVVFTFNSYSQTRFVDNLKVDANYHFGYNIPEYQMFTYITDNFIHSLNLSVSKQTIGKDEYEQKYKYPEYGFSIFYSTLGNDEVFGREISLTPFFKFNFIYRENFNLYSQIGVGIAYVNKKFDLEDNYLNVAVGSHINFHFNLRLGTNFKLTKRTSINLGLSFDHLSNANTNEPNLGINYLTAYTGISYLFGDIHDKKSLTFEPHIKKNHFDFVLNIGGKYSRALSSDKYITSSFSFEAVREFFKIFHMGIGADVFYDSSVEDQLVNQEKEYQSSDSFQTGIHLSQTLVYKKVSLTIEEGVYLILTEKVEDYPIYNRGIIKYQINKHLSIRLSMKSHLHILDYPELGFGYRL